MKRIKEAAELYLEATDAKPSENTFIGIQILEVAPSEP